MGDLYKIEFIVKFIGFFVNQVVEILIIGEYWQLFVIDFMLCWYVILGDVKLKVLKSIDIEDINEYLIQFMGDQWKCIKDDNNVLMILEFCFVKNEVVKILMVVNLCGQIILILMEVKVY